MLSVVSVESTAIRAMSYLAQRPALGNALFRFSKWGNPFSEDRYSWPYPIYDKMLAEGPIFYSRLYRQWFVLGHDEAQQVLRSPNASTTKAAVVLLELPSYRKLTPQVREAVSRWLLVQDPPDHPRMRAAVARAFTPRASAAHEASVVRVVDSLLDALPSQGEVDLVEAFTAQLPVHSIASLLGLPPERWEWLRALSQSLGSLLDALVGIDPDKVNRDVAELHALFQTTIDDRRRAPRADLVSALVSNENGVTLTDDEVLAMIGFLLFAGHETVTGALGNALVALDRNPDQRRLLLDRPEIIDSAVEELLRYDSSVQVSARSTTGPIQIGNVTIPQKAVVGVFIGAANRDPRRWSDADQLDVERVDNTPIMFGHGIHHCLGAALARLEMKTALPPLLRRFESGSLDLGRVQWKKSFILRGPTYLPARISEGRAP
jgi:pimeloyl-[acyl-carrier protein] synthase